MSKKYTITFTMEEWGLLLSATNMLSERYKGYSEGEIDISKNYRKLSDKLINAKEDG